MTFSRKPIYILKAHSSGYKPESKTNDRIFVEKIDFLSGGGGGLKVKLTKEKHNKNVKELSPLCLEYLFYADYKRIKELL